MTALVRPHVDLDLRPYFDGEEAAHHVKELIVCHETVSYNRPGIVDMSSVANYMDGVGLEIHGIIDSEGHFAWSYDKRAVYDHAASGYGLVNTRSIGIELVSEIPMLRPGLRFPSWWKRRKQLNKLARVIAWLHMVEGIPLRYSDGTRPGVTTHWHVSRTFLGGHGHWDCWPRHEPGGYFPALYVIHKARQILRDGP